MKFICITALTLVAGVLGSPVATAGPQLEVEESQFPNVSTILPDLLHSILGETHAIGNLILSPTPRCHQSVPSRRADPPC